MKHNIETVWDTRLRALEHILSSAAALPFVYSFPEGISAKDLRVKAKFVSQKGIFVEIKLKNRRAATFSASVAEGGTGLNKMMYQPCTYKKEKGAARDEKPKAILPGFSFEMMRRVVFWAWQSGLSHVASGDVKFDGEADFFDRLGFRFIRAELTPGNTRDPFNAAALVENGRQPRDSIKEKKAIAIAVLNIPASLKDLLEKLRLPGGQPMTAGLPFVPQKAAAAALK
jgi:hypothetical protein